MKNDFETYLSRGIYLKFGNLLIQLILPIVSLSVSGFSITTIVFFVVFIPLILFSLNNSMKFCRFLFTEIKKIDNKFRIVYYERNVKNILEVDINRVSCKFNNIIPRGLSQSIEIKIDDGVTIISQGCYSGWSDKKLIKLYELITEKWGVSSTG